MYEKREEISARNANVKKDAQKDAQKDGHTAVNWLGNDTIELVQKGHLTKPLVEQEYQQLVRMTTTHKVRWVLSDAETVSNFDASISAAGSAIVGHLKTIGVERVVIVVNSSVVRMMASTLGFAAGLPIKPVATRKEAMECLRRLQLGEKV